MSPSTMRHVIVAALVAVFVAPSAWASPAPSALSRQSLGQISFDGLDLSGDDQKKSNGKKKPAKPAKKNGKKGHHETPPAPETPPPSTTSSSGSDLTATPPPPAKPADTGAAMTTPGLDLSGPAPKPADTGTAAKPAGKPKAAPTMSFDAVDVSGKSAERQRLDAAIKLFKDGGYEGASLAFQEVIKDPKMAELQDEAVYMLGKSLYKMGLYHSALNQFKTLLARGANGKFFKSGLEWLFYIADKTVNEQIVLDEVAKYANNEFPDRFRSQFRYLLARYYFTRAKALDDAGQSDEAKKSFEECKKLVLLVPKGDRFYGKVKYLEGTVYFKEGAFAQALESFKEVVRSNNPRANTAADMHQRDLAFMQLARTHYGHRQNRYAIFYYDKVERGSDQWLESLFEASWAHFRIGQYERALGNLITLSSPFFKDEYFPEALILKAVVYYENCRYKEARAILEEFEGTYMPVHNELEKITGQHADAQSYWDILAEVQKRNKEGGKGATVVLERILKLALSDKDLKSVNDSIMEIEKEMDTIGEKGDLFRYSDLSKALNEGLKAERAALINKAGILAKAKLENELGQLKELLGQALRIKFETTSMEKEALEAELSNGPKLQQLTNNPVTRAVNDERLYWPYEGEYWRDELGTYEYTLTKACAKNRRGGAGPSM